MLITFKKPMLSLSITTPKPINMLILLTYTAVNYEF
ncbi:hypothetical protein BDD43_3339 [Mucilaginibacter gracilis]|uniref:Uncharacterized protein n=1 Tax=Mucilaginibacter gracilis TaxID=423350 RepID=A0A495J2H3_9SPHI|nr:hypothetical protein BDD43_3339 [Mucilaginibacter gracilis]